MEYAFAFASLLLTVLFCVYATFSRLARDPCDMDGKPHVWEMWDSSHSGVSQTRFCMKCGKVQRRII